MRREGRTMSHMVKLALAVVVLAAMAAYLVSLWQVPTYETSARVLVSFGEHDGQPQPIPKRFAPYQLAQTELVAATHSRLVAEEAIQRLGLQMEPAELLGNLTVEPMESTRFIVLTYEDTNSVRAQQVVNTVGEVSSRGPHELVVRAALPTEAASPHPWRNGLLTLVAGLALVGLLAFVSSRRREA
jgi:capsular polysaccharide biosynthesis protein